MKTNIHIIVPAISQEYDVLIPTFLTIAEITQLSAKAIEDVSEHAYCCSGNEILCRLSDNTELSPQKRAFELKIMNGEQFILL